jgi:hypothetical protein
LLKKAIRQLAMSEIAADGMVFSQSGLKLTTFPPLFAQKPMALQIVHSDTENNRFRLALWSDDLPVGQLESMLPGQEAQLYGGLSFKLEKRRKEWLKTRILLDNIAPGATMDFLPNGKPLLSGEDHISVSHSGSVAAVIIANQTIGLDVQPVDPKLAVIGPRFCNASDKTLLHGENVDHKLAMIWAAKEAVFKYFGEKVDFAGEMTMMPFEVEDETIHLDYNGRHGRGHFELGHLYWMGQHVLYTRQRTER